MSTLSLSPSGEAAWQGLRQHIEWSPGFWLGWVFTDHTPGARELYQRSADLLRGVGRQSELRQLSRPEELSDVLIWLLEGAEGLDGIVTVAVVRRDGAWPAAWDNFLLRLNERRELLRERLRGGLLLMAPTAFKPRSRDAAPDLWSIRSLALDVSPPTPSTSEPSVARRRRKTAELPTSDHSPALALQAVRAARDAGQAQAETEARIAAARALFAAGRRSEAREQAVLAEQGAPTAALKARGLVTLGDLEERLGDNVAAERHYRAALAVDPDSVAVWAIIDLASLLFRRGALDEALVTATAALAKTRALRGRSGDAPGLYDEWFSLNLIGDVQRAKGEWNAAAATCDDCLRLSRSIRALVGDTPEALRNESISVERVGDVRRARADWAGAAEAYEESLVLARRIRAMVGDTPESLRHEFVSLEHMGNVSVAQGDRAGAYQAYSDGLTLARQIRAMVGDLPDALRDEARALELMGNVYAMQSEWSAAAESYDSSLALMRGVRAFVGDTTETLNVIASSLILRALLFRCLQDDTAARGLLSEGVDLLRRVRARGEESSHLDSLLGNALRELAEVDDSQATALRAEAATLLAASESE